MQLITHAEAQAVLVRLANQDLYLHLETTNGAYAHQREDKLPNVGAYIRNTRIRYVRGSLSEQSPFRVGLKLDGGWVYAEGLTHWEIDDQGRLLLAGYTDEGDLTVALHLSPTPFKA